MNALWKALAAIGFASVLLFGSLSSVRAQTPPPVEPTQIGGTEITKEDVRAAIDSPTPNLANTTAYILYTITVIMNGTVNVNEAAVDSTRPVTLNEATENYGAIGGIGFLMGEMIKNQPASTQSYVAYVAGNSRLMGSPVYAQGIGFSALNPVLGTWVAFRNMAYYLLILMFFISGFLILIRHKISGQVAVTVQTILPRLVLTLILITFSYAIAGFVIDVMFYAIYFIINLFSGSVFHSDAEFFTKNLVGPKTLTDLALNTNIFEFTIGYVFNNEPGSAWGAANALGNMVSDAINAVVQGSVVGNSGAFGENGIFRGLITIIFTLIFGIALLIAMFRTFFALLMSYAGFVINTVLSPFILLPGVMPNNNAFGDWVKNLVAGMAPFVVAIFMIFMSLALTGSSETNRPGVGYRANFGDNSVEGLRLPLILTGESVDSSAFMGIIGMGFMLLLPEAVGITKKLVGAKGGIFDEYKDKAVGAFQKGWKGDSQMPFIPSAQSIVTKGGKLAAGTTVGAGAAGAYFGGRAGGNAGRAAADRFFGGNANARKILGGTGRLVGAVGLGGLGTAAGVMASPITIVGGGAAMAGIETGKKVGAKVKEQVTGADQQVANLINYTTRGRANTAVGNAFKSPVDQTAGFGAPGGAPEPAQNNAAPPTTE